MREQHIIGMEGQLRTFSKSIARSLSDMAIRHKAKEGQADARPQALNNRRRIRWITMRIVRNSPQRRSASNLSKVVH